MSGKRKGRPIELVVQWYGRTVGGRREAVCWMAVYWGTERFSISFVVDTRDMLLAAGGDTARLLMMVEHRWRMTWHRLRSHWREQVLGPDWRERKYERYKAAMMSEWVPDRALVIDCPYCGGTHQVARHRLNPEVRYECNGRQLTSPSHRARPR